MPRFHRGEGTARVLTFERSKRDPFAICECDDVYSADLAGDRDLCRVCNLFRGDLAIAISPLELSLRHL